MILPVPPRLGYRTKVRQAISRDSVQDRPGGAIPWELLASIIRGTSAVDLDKLEVGSLKQAESFLDCYGFDCENPDHRSELESVRTTSLDFIERRFTIDEPFDVPAAILDTQDMRQILIWASEPSTDRIQQWSCALLRVMHTIVHRGSYFNDRFGPEIRAQILGRFERHLKWKDDVLWLGEETGAVKLVHFEAKMQKSLDSVVSKLLHKPENVAASIFDRLGVRLVVPERFDVIRTVDYLRAHTVVTFANTRPRRTRNTLVDLAALEARVSANPDETALREWMNHQDYPTERGTKNPHSDINYHSVQFTCRQLIRVANPFAARQPGQDDIRFFFPFEVQIVDHKSYLMSREGLTAHDVYKERQRQTIKRRVLGALLQGRE